MRYLFDLGEQDSAQLRIIRIVLKWIEKRNNFRLLLSLGAKATPEENISSASPGLCVYICMCARVYIGV